MEVFMSTPATHSKSTIIPSLRYRKRFCRIDWLCQVFGFERHAVHEGPNGTIVTPN